MNPTKPIDDDELGRQIGRAAALPDAPASLIRAAEAMLSNRSSATLAPICAAALRLVLAVLRFDSAAQPAYALGMRSAGGGTRHLLFSAEGRDIDLRVHPGDGRFALSGQILGPDETGVVELSCGGEDLASRPRVTTLDSLGAFRFDDIPAGTCRMLLRLGSDEIRLPPIEAGPDEP